ncbi:PREDICTED: polygalacturonase-like, partial [Nelumbo nucifera]
MAKLIIPLLLLFLLFVFSPSNAVSYNLVSFGARPDGRADATKPFLRAWASACQSVRPSTIHVPRGRYLMKPAVFRGPCKSRILIKIDGTILAPNNYYAIGNAGNWLLFVQVTGLSVLGGTLDARGAGFWACRNAGRNCPAGARTITFNYANNILISGLTSINSQTTHVVVNRCNNVMVQKVQILAPDQSPNTDGIHVQFSTGVTIRSSGIRTGDDCISIGPGTSNLWIDHIACGPGHGISIGSLGKDLRESGVQNVTVKNAVFTGTDNGVRIKTWARPSSGYVRGVLYENIIMKDVKNPIIIDQRYCPDNQGCSRQ